MKMTFKNVRLIIMLIKPKLSWLVVQNTLLVSKPTWTYGIPCSIWHCVDCADVRCCIKSKDGTKLVSSSYVVLLDNEQKWTTLRRKRGAIVNAWCRIQNVVLFYIQWYILSLLSPSPALLYSNTWFVRLKTTTAGNGSVEWTPLTSGFSIEKPDSERELSQGG